MGKLEDALEKAGGDGGRSGGGLGGAMNQGGGASLQKGHRGASAEEQIAGKSTGPDEGGGERGRAMPTSPEAGRFIPE
jgi:hypothetical protein